MSIWQYDLYAIPRGALLAALGKVPSALTVEDADRLDLWRDVEQQTVTAKLNDLLPRVAGWDSLVFVWGADSGDRVDLHLTDAGIASLLFRLNLRRRTRGFVDRLISLAAAEDWLLLGEQSNRLFPAESASLIANLQRSDAARFVSDPEKFIRGLPDDEPE